MPRLAAILFLLIGTGVLVGGVWLAAIGGNLLYVLQGVGLIVTGVLLWRRLGAALVVYGVTLLATLIWAVVEVGFDWWQLVPRGGVPVLLGVLLLVPGVRNHLRGDARRPALRSGPVLALGAAVMASVVVAAIAIIWGDYAYGDSGRLTIATTGTAEIAGAAPVADGDWPAYGRTLSATRYSPLSQITAANVDRLEVAWSYQTGDTPDGGNFEATPIEIDGTLYLCTPSQYVIALDAATGAEVWRFEPDISEEALTVNRTCRGVSYWSDPEAAASTACAARIYMPTSDARLIALDATDGSLCPSFGAVGWIDLSENMPNQGTNLYFVNSPPVIARGIIVVGGSVSDNVSVNEPSGVIRGYDARTGTLLWFFDTGNPDEHAPLEPGETYTENSPNSWAPMSADEALGLVFAPLGNAPPDHYGVNRSEAVERFTASLIALDIETGELAWVTQFVHHDLWDMDVPAQASLVDLVIDGATVPALVQPTKQGDVYVLDRRTGEAILPITEVPAPEGAIPPDWTSPTQPVSALTFMPDPVEERDMWGVTLFDQLICRIRYHSMEYRGRYTPPSLTGTIQHPGNFGIFNWGGVAVDPVRQVMFGTPSYLAFTIRLVPRPDDTTPILTDEPPFNNENFGAPYAVDIQTFLSPIGLPCQAPPWGYVAGADLQTGQTDWMHRNGTVRDLAPVPLPLELGVPDLGGPMLTAGNVAFMSGTLDYFVRAFDVTTGEQLWRDRLPAGGHATPMTYTAGDGRQYLVVVAGGHSGLGTRMGDWVIAYALPDE